MRKVAELHYHGQHVVMRHVAAIIIAFSLVGCQELERQQQKQIDNEIGKINRKVAKDSEAQYNLAMKSGDKVEICVHAGLVAAAWLQAENEGQYLKWKKTQAKDCEAAGMPQE